MERKNLLSVQDVCRILNVSRRTVYYWIKKDILNPIRIGSIYRFHPDDIDNLIKNGKSAATAEKNVSILVIDDDPLLRRCLMLLLQKHGFKITVAASGAEALELYSKKNYDLVITDVRMPGMNGVETLKALRALAGKNQRLATPEIVMSAYHDEDIRKQINELGVRKFIQKPFDVEELVSTIDQNLN
jgi:excisionase family DNA binding protein